MSEAGWNRARPWILGAVVGMVLISGILVGFHFLPGAGAQEDAPDFTIQTVRDGNFTLSAERGSVVVVDLMAVDCPTCRVTEQSLLRLAQEHPDVVIVSVNIWTHFEDDEYLDQHLQRLNVTWPYGMDTDGVLFKYEAYEISAVAVVDADGRLSGRAMGAIGYDRLEGLVLDAKAGTGSGVPFSGLPLGLVGFALIAGVASFFAPCAFPLLPGYMAYTLSLGRNAAPLQTGNPVAPAAAPPRMREALVPGFAAAAGILLVYGLFGITVAALGETARPWLPLLQPGIGVLAVILGVALLAGATMDRVIAPVQRGTDRLVRLFARKKEPGTLTGYFSYGLGYGAAAAGCTAPVFLTLIVTAFLLGWATGVRIFLVYAGTAAILMILATLVAVKARGLLQQRSAQIVKVANRLSGIVLVLAGAYLLWFYHTAFGLPFLS